MPYTARNGFNRDPRMIKGARGCYFISDDDRQIFDGLSGLWCCGFGHNRAEIAEAVNRQLQVLDYSPAFQYGHPSVFKLADRLTQIAPASLNHVFFTNSGSESADTSLKLARAYWRMRGQPSKTRYIGRIKGYHGVNFAGTSLGGIGANRRLFGHLADADHLPHTLRVEDAFTRGQPQGGEELADHLEQLVMLHDASNIAAVIVEPMSGSAGVIVPPSAYLARLRALCDKHDILLIFDEVITGFARTGGAFGADTFGVIPDMMNLAKALTNGVIPMGAVLTNDEIYDAFVDEQQPDHMIGMPHGYTYSGHPVACAAALAALDIFEQDDMVGRAQRMAPLLEETLHQLKGLPYITDIRNVGMAGALQIAPRDADPLVRPYELGVRCFAEGLYVRWGGDTLQFAPPLTCTSNDLERMGDVLKKVFRTLK
ncbi:MAG: aminotransferase class III-fold pyridoxal phosphate-dependent enzyme [Gammaproteobacteria bacterium]|jgi:beta-alanine--pyruvate transaminase|nr:aminotransferase class III-fold pyridoxal phosphate-dependent enzyme [Gammaproteobacteria bacterium]